MSNTNIIKTSIKVEFDFCNSIVSLLMHNGIHYQLEHSFKVSQLVIDSIRNIMDREFVYTIIPVEAVHINFVPLVNTPLLVNWNHLQLMPKALFLFDRQEGNSDIRVFRFYDSTNDIHNCAMTTDSEQPELYAYLTHLVECLLFYKYRMSYQSAD